MDWREIYEAVLQLVAQVDWVLIGRTVFFWFVPPAIFIAWSYFRLSRGHSEDITWQANILRPIEDGKFVLQLRDVAPESTIKRAFEAPAMRFLIERLRRNTKLDTPILQTEGDLGWEIINKLMKQLAGCLAGSSLPRETWLFVVTCEDQKFVKKKSIRCFLIRPEDLDLMSDLTWAQQNLLLERRLHTARVLALHQIAKIWGEEKRKRASEAKSASNLIRGGNGHARIWTVSLPICREEPLLDLPHPIDWKVVALELRSLGLHIDLHPKESDCSPTLASSSN